MSNKRLGTSFLIATLFLLGLLAPIAWAAEVSLDARLEPTLIAPDGTAQLTVTVHGADTSPPTLPHVDGLAISSLGQSRQYQFVNGQASSSVSFVYSVTPQRAGHFTLPPIRIDNGSAAASPPLTLDVQADAPRAQQQRQGIPGFGGFGGFGGLRNFPGMMRSPQTQQDDEAAVAPRGQLAFLRARFPKKEAYQGELVPVRIKAYFMPGMQASISGYPSLKTDAFLTGQPTDKPRQTEETYNGRSYVVLTWNTTLSAVKTGTYSLAFQLPATLTFRERISRPRAPSSDDPFGDAFDESIFDNFFGKVQQKQVSLQSETEEMKVLPLPGAGRPADFSGAIGQFEVRASASQTRLTAGDPLTLKMEVTGAGNFDRVNSQMLIESNDFRSYPPTSRFTASDADGAAGTKTFEQAVVAQRAGDPVIPALRFSFFDPQARRYVTRTTAPIPLQVALAPAGRAVAAGQPVVSAVPGEDRQELLPNQITTGRFVKTLRPVFLQAWFLAAQGVPLLGLCGGLLIGWQRRRLAGDPLRARTQQSRRVIRAQLAAMDQAAARRDQAAFFHAARSAVQQRLGLRFGLTPEAITLSEIDARLPGQAGGLRPIFQIADQLTYTGKGLATWDPAEWKRTVIEQLTRLEVMS